MKCYVFAIAGLLVVLTSLASPVGAGVTSKVIQEALEFTTRKFGKEVAEEGLEKLATRMSGLAAKHGDDVVAAALKKVGPRTGKLVTEAGEHGADVIRLLARHGDAAIPLATRNTSLRLIKEFGTEAGEACVKHGSIAEPVIQQFGEAGAKALNQVTTVNGRRMAMLTADNTLKPELIDVVIRHGDKACEFVWRNKTTFAGAAALTAFVAAPEEFLNGTAQLTSAIAKPLAEVPKAIAVETVKHVPWTLFSLSFIGALTAVLVCLAAMWNDRRKYLSWAKVGGKSAWLWVKQRLSK